MNNFTFASIDYDNFNAKKYANKISGKTWLKTYSKHLVKYQDRLTTANCDKDRILKSILSNAFGVNIGQQIFNVMTVIQKQKTLNFIKWDL
jgi:hypothetical protein